MRLSLSLALSNIKPRRRGRHMGGAVLGVGLSLVPLLVVLVVSGGMIEGITARFVEIGTYHLQLVALGGRSDAEIDALTVLVAGAESVVAAFPERQGLGLLYSPSGRTGIQVRAVSPDFPERDVGFRRYVHLVEGSLDLSGSESILIGRAAARELEVGLGDELKLLTARRLKGRYLPRITPLVVSGVFTAGYQDIDKAWAYIPLATGRKILPDDSAQDIVGIKVNDPFGRLQETVAQIETTLEGLKDPPRVATWYQLEENQYRSFQTTKTLLVFIMILVVLVAAVNVSSSMIMLVLENTQEIGILKAIGATPALLTQAYVATGFFVGVAGCLVGIPLGLLLAVNVNAVIAGLEHVVNAAIRVGAYVLADGSLHRSVELLNPAFYLESIPVNIGFWETAAAALLAIVVSTAAAAIPARRVGRIRPIEVLRRH